MKRLLSLAPVLLLASGCALAHDRPFDPCVDEGVCDRPEGPDIVLAPECLGPYVILDDPARSVDYADDLDRCDRLTPADAVGGPVTPTPDDFTGQGWYRFDGAAGTSLPLTVTDAYRCGGDATGWLTGPLPSIADGVVDRQVCFRYFADECVWRTDVQVVHCHDFVLFRLPEVPMCHLRYCGADIDVGAYR